MKIATGYIHTEESTLLGAIVGVSHVHTGFATVRNALGDPVVITTATHTRPEAAREDLAARCACYGYQLATN